MLERLSKSSEKLFECFCTFRLDGHKNLLLYSVQIRDINHCLLSGYIA